MNTYYPYLYFKFKCSKSLILLMFFIQPANMFKHNLKKKVALSLLSNKSIYYSFSIWNKTKAIQSDVSIVKQKGFLKDLKLKDHKIETKQNNAVQQTKQKKSFNFLKQQRKVQNTRIKIKSQMRNPQEFLFESKFHQNGYDFNQQITNIEKFDEKIINKALKQQLIIALKQIIKQRQIILKQNMTKEEIFQNLIKFSNKSEENLKIYSYCSLYNKISQLVEKILSSCQNSGNSFNQAHYQMLNIISQLSLRQFYTYYLFKLLHIKNKQKIRQMEIQQAKLCWFIGQKLPLIQFQFANNKMTYDLQRYVQQFFQKKLQVIIQKLKTFSQNINEAKLDKQFQVFVKEIQFLMSIQKLFRTTHLTFGKHRFYENFIRKNIHNLEPSKQIKLKQANVKSQKIIKLLYLAAQNMVLDQQIIKKLENYLEFICQNFDPKHYVSEQTSKLLFDTYEKIGSIPDIIYDTFLAEYIYNRFSKDQYNLIQCIKFYVYSQCDDKLLLQSFFNKLQSLIDLNQFSTNKKSKHLLHFLFHFLCIKYPNSAKNKVSRKILSYCTTHTQKNHFILKEIMRFSQKPTKFQRNKQQQNKFISPCIQRQARKIQNNLKSELSTLQQKIFKECLEKVITKLNTDPDRYFYYEIKDQFSFCSFELDFVVLKWDSQKKQKLFGYLDTQCVGLQYSYDQNQCQNETQTAKKMQKMTLIQYEKGLKLIRKKMVRQSILKHYGWKIIYIPNKFLYQKQMSRQRFQEKLEEAILQKMAL